LHLNDDHTRFPVGRSRCKGLSLSMVRRVGVYRRV